MKNFVNKSLNHIASLRVTGAPLNCKKHAEHVFIHNPRVFRAALLSKLGLACLLTALLALPHCKNDDNGGGGGKDPIAAIYLWVTGCTVQGNMNGGNCPAPAGAPANGPERADAICANQYESDVMEVDRDRIAQEAGGLEVRHTALLARSNDPPREVFPVRGRGASEIKRPDETLIADSWDQFFDPTVDLSTTGGAMVVAGSNIDYWTGWWRETDQYTPMTSSGEFRYCGPSASYWTSNGNSIPDGQGGTGRSSSIRETRLGQVGFSLGCSNPTRILCITH